MANTTGKKWGGRKAGTPNKKTSAMRERIQTFLDNNWEGIQKDFDDVDPKDRLSFVKDLIKYVTPAYSAIDFNDVHKTNETFLEQLKKDINDNDIA